MFAIEPETMAADGPGWVVILAGGAGGLAAGALFWAAREWIRRTPDPKPPPRPNPEAVNSASTIAPNLPETESRSILGRKGLPRADDLDQAWGMPDFPPPLPPEPPPLPMVGEASYATRNDAFSPARVWTLAEATLRLTDAKGGERLISLAGVKDVRLEFAPTRPELNRYRCRLTLRSGEKLEFFNRTYAGLYDFRDTSADYRGFVRALMAALARHAPGCRYLAGATGATYGLSVLATVGLVLCLGLISVFLLATGLTWLIAIKLVIMVFYVPALVRWFKRNRPRPLDPVALAPEVLPVTVSAGKT